MLFFNLWLLGTLVIVGYLFALYPYSKLYHDLRGGMLKLICFVKLGRYVLGVLEFHLDDYNFERLKEVQAENGRPLEALLIMGIYNSSIR